MLGRCIGVGLFALLLVSMLPAVNADDTQQSSNLLTDGVSSNGYVCDPDGCSTNDGTDWWRIYAYQGDIVSIALIKAYHIQSLNSSPITCVAIFIFLRNAFRIFSSTVLGAIRST